MYVVIAVRAFYPVCRYASQLIFTSCF